MLKIVFPDADSNTLKAQAEQLDRLREFASLDVFDSKPASDEEFAERIKNADGVLVDWDLPSDVMRNAKILRVVSFSGTGVAQFVDLPQARERGIAVCNCPGYASNTVAEHALALLFAVAREIPRLDKSLRGGTWDQSQKGIEMREKTIGLIGFGGIGQAFAAMCQALGMRVLVWTRNVSVERAREHKVEFVSLDQLYEQCDIISLHAAFNTDTENMIDAAAFEKMNDGTILINTARAELIHEQACIDALNSGKLHGAGFDVFWEEPLPADHALVAMDNVVITPHIAYNTQVSVDKLYEIAVDNLVQFFNGTPINVVD
ncbi:MAG: NAD(P)-dependent oxidoreductase [Pseudomonadota bacterium]